MHGNSQTHHGQAPPPHPLGGESFATVLLVEADNAAAQAVRISLDGVLGDALRFERVTSLAKASTRLARGTVEVILVGRSVSDCGREQALVQLGLQAPKALILPSSTPDPGGTAAEAPGSGIDAHWLPRMLHYVTSRRQAEATLRQAEEALFEEKERAQVTLSSIGDAVLVTDAEGRVTYLNPMAEALTGWSAVEASGRALCEVFRIVDGHTRSPAVDPAQRAMREDCTVTLESNCVLLRRDGGEAGIEDSAAPIHDRHGAVSGAVIVFRDVSQSVAMTRKMAYLAQHDPLTGLPNRVLLNERLTQAIRFARRHDKQVALLFVDLDRFKEINDSLGHVVGDHMLQAVAHYLSSCVRATDTVSRLGGDEFVILLTEIDGAEDAAQVADKVLMRCGRPFLVDGHRLEVSLSVGVSVYPEDGETVETMLQHADAAMYQAKAESCRPERLVGVKRRTSDTLACGLEGRLRHALGKGQLLLHYQPQVDLASGAVVGLEALLRWMEPKRGLLGPNRFISVAERTGLIVPIGRWVLAEACRQVRAWQAAGLGPPPVSINVSAVELRQEGFVAGVAETLRESAVQAGQVVLELTESALMRHGDGSVVALGNLREQGVGLAIDGFGTGHSSLAYLRRFPVDTIKVHGSFLQDVTTVADSAVVMGAILDLGHKLGHTVIAQGVETEEQLAFLQAQGCAVGQGFHLGGAGDASDTALLLAPPPRRLAPGGVQ